MIRITFVALTVVLFLKKKRTLKAFRKEACGWFSGYSG